MSKFCPECRKENKDNATFCKSCGGSLQEVYKNPLRDPNMRTLGFIGAGISLIGLIFHSLRFQESIIFIIPLIFFIIGTFYMYKSDKNGIIFLIIAGITYLLLNTLFRWVPLLYLIIILLLLILSVFGAYYSEKNNKIGGILLIISATVLIISISMSYFNNAFQIIGALIIGISGILCLLNLEVINKHINKK
ncbi:hypothetical protein MBCUT_16770 [Methanobrevibacter cuticularis]|uniref:Zinc-ribbon domain-containing protein n=1 Tax=Methanobrevibacter cuticularis TaxID=47311 RepID=A0A166CLF1_9EURY|nr:zinc ribbon domain-containing protein [Methanobrevibacter cuticularis]KZX15217.1 hypothetical protein MBCUT_16770 [Methanobrevibacter cuticularis]